MTQTWISTSFRNCSTSKTFSDEIQEQFPTGPPLIGPFLLNLLLDCTEASHCHLKSKTPHLNIPFLRSLSFTPSKAHSIKLSTPKCPASLKMPLSFLPTSYSSYLVPSPE